MAGRGHSHVVRYLKAFAECVDAQIEEQLPSLLLGPQLLPDPVQPLVEVYAQTGQHLFLCYVYSLGMPFPAPGLTIEQNDTKHKFVQVLV